MPVKIIMDTNVPVTANLALKQASGTQEIPDLNCIEQCINAVEHITQNGGLVIDASGEIFDEYLANLSLSSKGQPGFGDLFMKWLHDHQWNFSEEDRVKITKSEGSYLEFPTHEGLRCFDPSDKKFVAVANEHPDKPPILQATDSKWWGWKEALGSVGIKVIFLCPIYIQNKYAKKMGQ